jgi:hypothetical protein
MTDEELTAFLRDLPFLRAAKAADRIEQLVAINEALTVEREWFEEEWVSAVDKLNKAVEALREIYGNGDATGRNPQLMANIARTTLAEIEGEKG